MPTRDSRDQSIPNDACRRHCYPGLLGLREREAHILERERHHKTRSVVLFDDLVAINPMDAAGEHR